MQVSGRLMFILSIHERTRSQCRRGFAMQDVPTGAVLACPGGQFVLWDTEESYLLSTKG